MHILYGLYNGIKILKDVIVRNDDDLGSFMGNYWEKNLNIKGIIVLEEI